MHAHNLAPTPPRPAVTEPTPFRSLVPAANVYTGDYLKFVRGDASNRDPDYKGKGVAWSKEEKMVIVGLIYEYKKKNDSSNGQDAKFQFSGQMWQELTDKFNQLTGSHRTLGAVRKFWPKMYAGIERICHHEEYTPPGFPSYFVMTTSQKEECRIVPNTNWPDADVYYYWRRVSGRDSRHNRKEQAPAAVTDRREARRASCARAADGSGVRRAATAHAGGAQVLRHGRELVQMELQAALPSLLHPLFHLLQAVKLQQHMRAASLRFCPRASTEREAELRQKAEHARLAVRGLTPMPGGDGGDGDGDDGGGGTRRATEASVLLVKLARDDYFSRIKLADQRCDTAWAWSKLETSVASNVGVGMVAIAANSGVKFVSTTHGDRSGDVA
eukprot:jgi/Mesen1/9806/ME000007S09871